nr:uncharacterized protein LOC127348211 [Lolium perenne]
MGLSPEAGRQAPPIEGQVKLSKLKPSTGRDDSGAARGRRPMLLRFLGRICGDAVGSAARRLHRDVGDEVRECYRALYHHRRCVQFRAEMDLYAGVCHEAARSARKLRKNVEDEGESFCRDLWAQRFFCFFPPTSHYNS